MTAPANGKERYERYGFNLLRWVIYEHIVKGVSLEKIQTSLEDVFNLPVSRTTLHNFKFRAADYYETTYEQILWKLFRGRAALHVDETPVKLAEAAGYVWTFTNMEDVAFIYRATREGQFLKDLLKDFEGVLVSDFYGAYDSLDCEQQKCLIHLIRDMNDDLHKNPFDEELKTLAHEFAALVTSIVHTIDRYGLKKRHLNKHNKAAEKFYEQVFGKTYVSELAFKYQKRLERNREKLFTFLHHDGVSWNNNIAEHAMRHFAIYRKRTDGVFSERGLSAYLVLLSIYQTCRYKGMNFMDFLLSGERRIA